MDIKLVQVRLERFRDAGGGEVILDFNNDRHHSIRIPRGKSPEDIAHDLIQLGEWMLKDKELRSS